MKMITKMNNGTMEISIDERVAPISGASFNPTIEQMEAIQRNTDAQRTATKAGEESQEPKQKVSVNRKK